MQATTWMSLENTLSEITQSQNGQILYDSTYMKYLEWANSQKQKGDQKLPGAGEGGGWGTTAHGYRTSI